MRGLAGRLASRRRCHLPAYRATLQESPRYLTRRALMSLSRGDSPFYFYYLFIYFCQRVTLLIGVKGKMRLIFDPFQEV